MRLTSQQRRDLATSIEDAFDAHWNKLTQYGEDIVTAVEAFLGDELGFPDPSIDVANSVHPATRRLEQVWGEDEDPRVLAWCATHGEPAWRYSDGSTDCWHERISGNYDESHTVTAGPWELRGPASVFTRPR